MPNDFLNYTPQDAPNFSPNRPTQGGADMSFLEDPAFQTEFQKVLDSTPGLAEAMSSDPDLANHIMGSLAARQPLPLGGGPDMELSEGDPGADGLDALSGRPVAGRAPVPSGGNPFAGFDVSAVGGALPGAPAPQAPAEESFMRGPQQEAPPANFREYLNSQGGKDDFMMGLIMSNYGQNPEKALQLAMQFKQNKDLRKQQAEQNELQRDATRENIKLKKEQDKQIKEDKQWQNDRSKGIAVLRQNGLTEEDLVARHGIWDKDNNEDMTRGVTALVAEEKQRVKDEKEAQQDFTNKQNIARAVHTNGRILANQYTNKLDRNGKPNPKYDEDYAKGLTEIEQSTKARNDLEQKLQEAKYEAMKAEAKLKSAKRTDEQKLSDKIKFTKLGDIEKRMLMIQGQLNTYEPYKEGNNPYGNTYRANLDRMAEVAKEYSDVLNSIGVEVDLVEAVPTPSAPEEKQAFTPPDGKSALPTGRGGASAPQPADASTAAPATAPAGAGAPVEKSYIGFKNMMAKATTPEEKEEVRRKWRLYYPGYPEPTE